MAFDRHILGVVEQEFRQSRLPRFWGRPQRLGIWISARQIAFGVQIAIQRVRPVSRSWLCSSLTGFIGGAQLPLNGTQLQMLFDVDLLVQNTDHVDHAVSLLKSPALTNDCPGRWE